MKMDKENMASNSEQPNVQITRARAKSFGTVGGLPALKPPMINDQKKVVGPESKRAVTDSNNATVGDIAWPQRKKRGALQDVTNMCRKKSNIKGSGAQAGNGVERDFKPVPAVVNHPHIQQGKEARVTKESTQGVQKFGNIAVHGNGSADLMAANQASVLQAKFCNQAGYDVEERNTKPVPAVVNHPHIQQGREARVTEDSTKPVPTVVNHPHSQQGKEACVTKESTQGVQKFGNSAVHENGSADPMAANQASVLQAQSCNQARYGVEERNTKLVPAVVNHPHIQQGREARVTEESTQGVQKVGNLAVDGHGSVDLLVANQASVLQAQSGNPSRPEVGRQGIESELSDGLHVADIDSNHRDPQMCAIYAPAIYENQRVKELERRPYFGYMEMQRDITHIMRGVLIDWLVEVSDECNLVADTLYLTANLIDRFLSRNFIEKQRLQLLGVTCMLIASKFEEICPPNVEEFCYITDNTYKRNEVLHMESQVLNLLGFQLAVPTTKKFLRRFLQAAQSNYQAPRVKLELLANYLAELTLPEYGFLLFLPSLIAASAIFLARWMLDPSSQPWNPTLQHYTNYKASDLKLAVIGLQQLHLNTNNYPLKSVREKYNQPKFKCVANLPIPQPLEEAFRLF